MLMKTCAVDALHYCEHNTLHAPPPGPSPSPFSCLFPVFVTTPPPHTHAHLCQQKQGATRSMLIDHAYLLESQFAHELPETLIGAIRWVHSATCIASVASAAVMTCFTTTWYLMDGCWRCVCLQTHNQVASMLQSCQPFTTSHSANTPAGGASAYRHL